VTMKKKNTTRRLRPSNIEDASDPMLPTQTTLSDYQISSHWSGGNPKSNIELPVPLVSVKPGKNFYKYVNGNWLQHASIPPFRTSFGVSEEVELLIERQLSQILDKCYKLAEKGDKPSTKREKMMDVIGRLMLSSMRRDKQHNSLEFLRRILRPMVCIRGPEDIMERIGMLNRRGVSTFMNVSIFQKRNPSEYTFLVGCGSLGLPDDTYYSGTAPGKTQTLLAYVKLCEQLGKTLFTGDLRTAVQTEAALSGIINRYKDDTFEDIEGSKLATLLPGIAWDTLFKSYGAENWKSKTIRVYSVKLIKQFEKCLRTWPLESWSNLFTLHTVLYALPILPPPYDDLHFQFFGKRLRGQIEKLPQGQLTLNLVRTLLRIPLSYLYVQEYIEPSLKKDATKFAETIHAHAMERLAHVDWLEEDTKKVASRKLKAMNFSISNPDHFPNIDIPDLITDNFLQNMFLLSEMNTDTMISRIVRRAEPESWDEAPYTVNAYYFNERNQFVLPAGSIQWPFYRRSSERIGWNYGGLGAVIGHEITHAFDMDGKEYNEKGEKKSWWTKKDNAQYKKKTDAIIKMFDHSKMLGHPVDGYLTLSENIADLGGLAIALDALHQELAEVSEEEKKKQMRDFFTAYAVSWRVKERSKKVIQSLFMDVHAPAELRVNLIVSQFDEWYDLFGVVTGDDLYVPPEERVQIF
jgi:putative endopeptidase